VGTVQRAPVTGVVLLVALLTVVQGAVGLGAVGWTAGLVASTTGAALLALGLHRTRTTRFGPANVVTLVRATLGQAVAALVAASFAGPDHRALLVSLAAIALALDLVDGRVARQTGSVTALGARFDMETDAFLILVLSIAVGPVVGWWVLAIGFARYALLLAEGVWPWLRVPVGPRPWRASRASPWRSSCPVWYRPSWPRRCSSSRWACWPSRSEGTWSGSRDVTTH